MPKRLKCNVGEYGVIVNSKNKVLTPLHCARWGIEKPPKYSVFFLCKVNGSTKVKLSHEHTDSKWVAFKEINKIPFHNKNSKIAIQKAQNFL